MLLVMKTKKIFVPILALIWSLTLQTSSWAEAQKSSEIYQIPVKTIDGEPTTLRAYQGQVMLIVNTASGCGYTPQYKGLESLYTRYKSKGLVVLGFPSNDFFSQEPGTNAQIKYFCKSTYQVDFPLFDKASVKGDGIQPLFRYLQENSEDHSAVSWNFNKYLVGRDGKILHHWKSGTAPESDELVKAVEEALLVPTPNSEVKAMPVSPSKTTDKKSKI